MSTPLSDLFCDFLSNRFGKTSYHATHDVLIIFLPRETKYKTSLYGLSIFIQSLENKYCQQKLVRIFNLNLLDLFPEVGNSKIEIDFDKNKITIYYFKDSVLFTGDCLEKIKFLQTISGYKVVLSY